MLTASSSSSFQSLLARAWSGALPLWQIFWLGLVLISFALAGLLRFVVADVLFAFSVKNSLLLFFLLALAGSIEAAVSIPLLHIADPTAREIRRAGHSVVGLLGTRFTMEQEFYRNRLERHGLRVLIPETPDREIIHRVIYEELCLGAVRPESRAEYRRIMGELAAKGAQAIILGCTEISLLVNEQDSEVPLFDTTAIHARAAAEEALER